MAHSIFVVTIAVINVFLQVTNANPQNSNADSNGGHQSGQNYHKSQDTTHIDNFGNGDNKHNFVKLDENPDSLSVSGISYGQDTNNIPSQQNLQVNLNNPPKTLISNIGNGIGNRNVFVLNDNTRAHPKPYYDDQNFRGFNNRHQPGEILVNSYIGRGLNNANKIYVNGQRINVDPNNADTNDEYHNRVQTKYGPSYRPRTKEARRRRPANSGYFTEVNFYSNNENIFDDPLLKELPMYE